MKMLWANKNINIKNLKNEDNDNIYNKIFYELNNDGITDYHFTPHKDFVDISVRYNGDLIKIEKIFKNQYNRLLNRILINCGLDIIKDFKNLDGSFELNDNFYRVSFMKSFFGISCVMRKLKNIEKININIPTKIEKKILEYVNNKSGLIIFSGPTGSGKTTTLNYYLNKLKDKMKIHTIDNPIEYIISGIVQISLLNNESIDILKYILRQDPELISVGEIRERSYAKFLFETITTGHYVFSTVHSDSIENVLNRFYSMGIKNEIIKFTDMILNQRLLPGICKNCKGKGCKECMNTGKKGFFSIFDCLILNDDVKKYLLNNTLNFEKIKNFNFISKEEQFKDLKEKGLLYF
ncbi:GspE/PulE family protein [Oceanotoga teriensis]|jgi:type IV pilus assembly protein PilB|uniref:GspE/PulE family protein n=1 Tax=Oceanotoga teriensis TaxID=515440 RepID=UPI00271317B8|nr:ATPase, T2SS/T4P/T4SS family [Oceanotoga teriensis]MDO7977151.1 Flp pilus assembly complex ATPase component TadA [Oceanotoga teriensis]